MKIDGVPWLFGSECRLCNKIEFRELKGFKQSNEPIERHQMTINAKAITRRAVGHAEILFIFTCFRILLFI